MGTLDDMNHLKNKRIRSVADLIQDQLGLALPPKSGLCFKPTRLGLGRHVDWDGSDNGNNVGNNNDSNNSVGLLSLVLNDKRDVKPPVAKPISNKKRTYNSNISQILSSNPKVVRPFMVADIETILMKDDTGMEVQTPYASRLVKINRPSYFEFQLEFPLLGAVKPWYKRSRGRSDRSRAWRGGIPFFFDPFHQLHLLIGSTVGAWNSLLKMEEKIAEAAPSPSKIEKDCTLRSIPTNAKIKERTNRLDQRKAISSLQPLEKEKWKSPVGPKTTDFPARPVADSTSASLRFTVLIRSSERAE
ncbi:hypothetical protein AgCh_006714 [Apium graveolens]